MKKVFNALSKRDAEISRKRWRDGYGPKEVAQRVRPHEEFGYIDNPHRGTQTFQRFNGDPLYPTEIWNDSVGPVKFRSFHGDPKTLKNKKYPPTTSSYCRWLWSVIEPEKGEYRWDIIDGALLASRQRGQTLHVRIQPYILKDMPSWYWKKGGVIRDGEAGKERKEADANSPAYLKHWGDLIRAFGKRYDGHPNLEAFDIAYGGPCGEMGGNANEESSTKLVDVYLNSFKKTQLVSMIGTSGCRYGVKTGKNLGWRGDCFGDLRVNAKGVPSGLSWNHMYDEYPHFLHADGVQEAWRTAPVTLETCWTVGHIKNQGWDIDWILEQGLKYHPTFFMSKSCAIPEAWKDKIDVFDRKLGYRFVLRQFILPLEAKPGQKIEFNMFIDNVGVAPIYRPYRLALRFRQGKTVVVVPSTQDLRRWMPGIYWFSEKVKLPSQLKAGEVKVDVGILDIESDVPKVKFAIQEIDADGWHPITSMGAL